MGKHHKKTQGRKCDCQLPTVGWTSSGVHLGLHAAMEGNICEGLPFGPAAP